MDIKNIEVIDLRQVKNCWIVQMLPFSYEDKNNNKLVNEYQEFCFKNKFFGIGWSNDDDEKHDRGRLKDIFKDVKTRDGNLSDDFMDKINEKIEEYDTSNNSKNIKEIYQKVYNKINSKKQNKDNETVNKETDDNEIERENDNDNDNGSLKRAINDFFSIEKGDIVITRLRNGKYLIGQVKDGIKYFEKEDEEIDIFNKNGSKGNGFSWRCKVDEWVSLQRSETVSDIIGIFSQRNQKAIYRSKNDKIKLLALKLYQENRKNVEINIPPIILNENNFAISLNADELEDLVYLYILEKEKDKNLILLPSYCKISEPMYEFYLKDKDSINSKNITCQVKNRKKVNYSDYIEQKDAFEKIYLFSGINDYGKCTKEYDSIKKIPSIDLYRCLSKNKAYFSFLNNKKYYIIEQENSRTDSNDFAKEIDIRKYFEYEYNGWSMHKSHQKREKKFKVNFFDDNGNITYISQKNYNKDEKDINEYPNKIRKNRIQSIEFFINGDKDKFYYNNEFKCFILNGSENNDITNFINEVKPIVKEIIE